MWKQYFKSASFNQYGLDWIIVGVLLVIFFQIVEPAKPFFRQFKLSDSTLQHPFATKERVTDNELYFLSAIVPSFIIVVVRFFLYSVIDKTKATNSRIQWYHSLHLSLLGLSISLSINGVVTDILKNLIGRPRPDFLHRCGPRPSSPFDDYVDISVCTSPLGLVYLLDGMKSTPSGHSLIGFSGLFYLTLWLIGQIHQLKQNQYVPMIWYLLSTLPTLLASYIALSRTQDYRHHFIDILLGSLIGIVFSSLSYVRYVLESRSKPINA